jgi:hypothetical protein
MNRKYIMLGLAALLCALPRVAQAQDTAKPMHAYRITYTLTTTEGGKRIGAEFYAMTLDTASNVQDGHIFTGRGNIKVGQKIPVATGSFSGDHNAGTQTQFTYLDIGINIDATLTEATTGLLLVSKVEQSSVAPQPAIIAGVSEPVIRQVVLNNSSGITLGKTSTLTVGSMHLPDTQRRIDVEVNVEQIP